MDMLVNILNPSEIVHVFKLQHMIALSPSPSVFLCFSVRNIEKLGVPGDEASMRVIYYKSWRILWATKYNIHVHVVALAKSKLFLWGGGGGPLEDLIPQITKKFHFWKFVANNHCLCMFVWASEWFMSLIFMAHANNKKICYNEKFQPMEWNTNSVLIHVSVVYCRRHIFLNMSLIIANLPSVCCMGMYVLHVLADLVSYFHRVVL